MGEGETYRRSALGRIGVQRSSRVLIFWLGV
jgi:hypothetical protein